MGKKSDRQAVRIAAARWLEFCDSRIAIGRAAERGLLTAEARANVQRYRRVDSLVAMAAMLGEHGRVG